MSQEDKNLASFMERVNKLFEHVPDGKPTETGFDRDFQNLKKLSVGLKQSDKEEYLSSTGQKPENKKKNRYKDITPFDSTRVQLTATNDDPNSDYINASLIRGADKNQRYIASQGPLPHTVLDFWQMLWQYNVSVIVMVCREIELGKKKCERYWADRGESKEFGGITVTLEDKKDLIDGYCLRTIKAEKGNVSRTIHQFHYTSWPDHGVPKTCFEIITLINHVRDVQSYSLDETTPLCVHCSAGCGRTGAVLAVDFVRNLLNNKRVPPDLNMYDIVSEMRRQRPAIVQTKDQYEFVNTAVTEMFRIYLHTRTVAYKDFSVGYQGEQYVNINISSEEKPKDRRNGVGPPRPATLQYENVDLRNRPKEGVTKLNSLEDYPAGSPPAKPVRPISTLLPDSVGLGFPKQGERKQSVPVVPANKVPPPPNAKPRVNSKPNFNARNPAAHERSAAGSTTNVGRDGTKPQPPASKPKLDVTSKNLSSSPIPKSPGNPECHVTTSHGKSAPILSSPNKLRSSLSFPLTPNNNNNNVANAKQPPEASQKPLVAKKGVKSPLSEKVSIFEAGDKKRSAQPKAPPRKPKSSGDVLKIREENDSPSEEESDSPKLKESFVIQPTPVLKVPLPNVKPKPKVAMKPKKDVIKTAEASVASETSMSSHKKQFANVLRNSPKSKPHLRPVSQNFALSSPPNTIKTGMSASVFDLSTEGKKMPPPVPQKTSIVRSASISGVNREEGEKAPFEAMRAKFQAAKPGPKETQKSEDADVQVKVISFTQGDGSYGPVYAATRSTSSLRVQSPKPYNPQSRLSISKSSELINALESTRTSKPNTTTPDFSLHAGRKTALAARKSYENTDFFPKATSTQNVSPDPGTADSKTHEYVNTQYGPDYNAAENKVSLPPQYENHAVAFKIDLDGTSDDTAYANAPPIAPPQSSKPKLDLIDSSKASNLQDSHGSVSATSNEGGAVKPIVPTKPKAVEENKPPLKPQPSVRRNPPSRAVSADAANSPATNRSPKNFKKYQKTNVYSDVILDNDNPPHLIPETEYEFGENVPVQRTASNASGDKSPSTPRKSSGPPRLPMRTPESQMFLSESPPALPTRTAESYETIEGFKPKISVDGDEVYEAVDTTAPAPPSSPRPGADTGRRTSSNPTSTGNIGTTALKAKAKKLLDNTTSAISKVGASISKSVDDDNSSSPPSTIGNRTPTYAHTPVVYNSQDMSFGKRLKRKVKGGRKQK